MARYRATQYQKGKTNLDFIEARDSEWQWCQLGHMQVCTLLQTHNHASTHTAADGCRSTTSGTAVGGGGAYHLAAPGAITC